MASNWFPALLLIIITGVITHEVTSGSRESRAAEKRLAGLPKQAAPDSTWIAPILDTDQETTGKERAMVIYGEALIAHTAAYFGPNGTVARNANGMNCQNCHLAAGTQPWGNNYGAVYATYPQLRSRSNSIQDIYGRVNDCFERSLNAKAIERNSLEMQSIYTYMKWLGRDVPKGVKPYGSGLPKLTLLTRAADPGKGRTLYINSCKTCHGDNGQGQMNALGNEYTYPPLWGKHGYNDGAGLYRLSSFASFAFNNMPYNMATHQHPALSNEAAWDIAAFVNQQPRPHMDQSKDWPDITKKPFDAPYGPYADSFSQKQHKYGPFGQIIAARAAKK